MKLFLSEFLPHLFAVALDERNILNEVLKIQYSRQRTKFLVEEFPLGFYRGNWKKFSFPLQLFFFSFLRRSWETLQLFQLIISSFIISDCVFNDFSILNFKIDSPLWGELIRHENFCVQKTIFPRVQQKRIEKLPVKVRWDFHQFALSSPVTSPSRIQIFIAFQFMSFSSTPWISPSKMMTKKKVQFITLNLFLSFHRPLASSRV